MNASRFGLAAAVLLATTSLLAPSAGAQDTGLAPFEAAWFERWGISPDDRVKQDSIVLKSRAHERLDELVAASDSGDYVAWLITWLALAERCNGGERIGRPHCAALAHWAFRHPARRYRLDLSREAFQWAIMDPRIGDVEYDRALEIGKMLELGIGGPPDYRAARWWYGEIDDGMAGDDAAMEASYRLGVMAEHGRGGPPDPKRAHEHYREAANKGHPQAAFTAATYAIQTGDSSGIYSIDHLLETAAGGGIASAAFLRAHRIEHASRSSARSRSMLFRYYRQAALAGHIGAMSGLARAYYNGWGTVADEDAAEDWWEKAARAGDGEAAYRVAAIHTRRGDYDGAMPWLRRAAEAGVPRAAEHYESLRANGYRERSIKGTLLGIAEFFFDAQAAAAEQRRQEQALEESITRATLLAVANDRVAAMNAAGSGGGGGGGTSGGIILRDDSEFQAEQEALRRIAEQEAESSRSRMAQATAQADAQASAERAAADAALKRRREAALIACYGSLEAARTARFTCQ